jgi:hypothetical protein
MAILKIPTRRDISVYDFTIELDSVVFTISMFYNTRAGRWFFSMADIDGNPLRQGLKLVANWNLLTQWTQQGRPEGAMICANPETDDDPNRDTLEVDAFLCYDEGGAFG